MNTAKNRNQNNQNIEDKFYLKVDNPEEFKGTLNGEITTTLELSKRINTLFGKVYEDYEACIILFNPDNTITATLYFKDKGGGHIIPLSSSRKDRGISPMDRIYNMNLRTRNKTYKLSDELQDVLKQFMFKDRISNRVNLNKNINEVSDNYGGRSNIYLEINNIDVTKVLRAIYGSMNKDQDRLEYAVTFLKAMGGFTQGLAQNYIIKIDQINSTMVDKLAAQVGTISSINSIPMVRGY